MMEFGYPILEHLLVQLMVVAVGVDFPSEGVGPAPYIVENPPPEGHPLTEMILRSPAPPSTIS